MRHARNAMALGATVTGFDADAGARARAAKDGVLVSDSRAAALSDASHAIVATPSIRHADDLAVCLGSARHVLVEKPLTHDPAGMSDVLAQAMEKGIAVTCGFNLRYHEVVRLAKRQLESGIAGRILWASFIASSDLRDWRPGQDIRQNYTNNPDAGGVLFDCSHEVDLACYLLGPGSHAFSHTAQSGLLNLVVEDIAVLGIAHERGGVSTVQLDYCSKPARRTVLIRGELATLSLDLLARRLETCGVDGSVLKAYDGGGSFDADYAAEMRDFLGLGDEIGVAAASGHEGLMVSELIVAARAAGPFLATNSSQKGET